MSLCNVTVLFVVSRRNWRWFAVICGIQADPRKPAIMSSCSVLLPEIVLHDAFNVILWTSVDICVVHDDLGWKNRTTRYICRFSAKSLALRVIFVCRKPYHTIVVKLVDDDNDEQNTFILVLMMVFLSLHQLAIHKCDKICYMMQLDFLNNFFT